MHIYNLSLWKYQKTLKQNVRKFPVVSALIPFFYCEEPLKSHLLEIHFVAFTELRHPLSSLRPKPG